jgi:hypothetical protein
MPMLGQNRFGMELHAFDVECLMADAHDFIDIAFLVLRPGGHFQAVGQGRLFDHQGMITGRGERVFEPLEHADVMVVNLGGLAVHDLLGMDDVAAEGVTDALMAKADTEDRIAAGELHDRLDRDAGFPRGAGARRNHDLVRRQALDVFDRDLVVTHDRHVRSQFAEILHQVVGERIVIVDHYQFDCAHAPSPSSPASAMLTARKIARPLFIVSSHSLRGIES